jgi:hypothetical protein
MAIVVPPFFGACAALCKYLVAQPALWSSSADTQLPVNGGVSGAVYLPECSVRNSQIHSAFALVPVHT